MICHFCKSVYFPERKWRPGKFCSKKCASNSFKRRKIKTCIHCNSAYEIPVSADKNINRSKYCSVHCRRISVKNQLTRVKEVKCEICFKQFEIKPAGKQRFCSIPCYRIYQRSPSWIKELSSSGTGAFNSFKKQDLHCTCCQRKGDIHIHHRDGNNKNNHPNNWAPLCSKCHKVLHTFYNESQKSLKSFTDSFLRFWQST